MAAELIAESTKIFKDVAARFILDDWYYKEYEGQEIMRFLAYETSERWQIPHYFVTAFDHKSARDSTFQDLTWLLREVAEDDILLGEYLNRTEALLKQTLQPEILATVEYMFGIYRKVKVILHSGIDKEQQQAQIAVLVHDHEHLSDWEWL